MRKARQNRFPPVSVAQQDNILSLHLGTPTVQSAMNLHNPTELVLSYSQTMMAWLLFTKKLPQHITHIGLGGGSFARWLAEHLPNSQQVAVEINPQVIQIAQAMFQLPEQLHIVEDNGATYINQLQYHTDLILLDAFDGEQIIVQLVETPFFTACHRVLSDDGVLAINLWQGDKRFHQFVEALSAVFHQQVLIVPASSHGNATALAFKSPHIELNLDKLKRHAQSLSSQYHLDFKRMLCDAKAFNPHNNKDLQFLAK